MYEKKTIKNVYGKATKCRCSIRKTYHFKYKKDCLLNDYFVY